MRACSIGIGIETFVSGGVFGVRWGAWVGADWRVEVRVIRRHAGFGGR